MSGAFCRGILRRILEVERVIGVIASLRTCPLAIEKLRRSYRTIDRDIEDGKLG